MTVVFHVLAGAAIAHAAASRLERSADGGYEKPSLPMVALVGLLGVLSHGILDGLKHGYPIPAGPGIILGAALAAVWVLAVRPRLALLFAAAIVGALLPDLIDLGPDMLRGRLGLHIPVIQYGHIFPWHWPEGSGAMQPGWRDKSHDLRAARNQAVSYVNHAIVVVFALAGILMAPGAFRSRSSR